MAEQDHISQDRNIVAISMDADKPGRTIVLERVDDRLTLTIEPGYDHWTWLSRADAAKLVIALGLWATEEAS